MMDRASSNLLRLRRSLEAAEAIADCASATTDWRMQRQLHKASCDLLERSLLSAITHSDDIDLAPTSY